MANGPYLERLAPFDVAYGYDVNRVVESLTNQRGGNVPLISSYAICFGYQPVDAVFKARCRFWVTPNVDTVIKVYLSFTLQPFHVGNQTTASSTSSTASGDHNHLMFQNPAQFDGVGSSTIRLNARNSDGGIPVSIDVMIPGPTAVVDLWTWGSGGNHTHSIPSVNLNPPSAIYEAGMAQGVHVFIDNVDRTTALGGPWGVGSALDISALDCTQFIQTVGWHEFQLSSTSIGGITAQLQYQSLINSTL